MNYIEVAHLVLAESKQPLSVKEIVSTAVQQGLLKTSCNNPKAIMATSLYRDIRRRGTNSLFQVERGEFSLNLLSRSVDEMEVEQTTISTPEKKKIYKLRSIYKWRKTSKSVSVCYRENDPYEQYCPKEQIKAIMNIIAELVEEYLLVDSKMIISELEKTDIAPGRLFKKNKENYKIFMALGILQIEGLLEVENKKRKKFSSIVRVQQIKEWIDSHI